MGLSQLTLFEVAEDTGAEAAASVAVAVTAGVAVAVTAGVPAAAMGVVAATMEWYRLLFIAASRTSAACCECGCAACTLHTYRYHRHSDY